MLGADAGVKFEETVSVGMEEAAEAVGAAILFSHQASAAFEETVSVGRTTTGLARAAISDAIVALKGTSAAFEETVSVGAKAGVKFEETVSAGIEDALDALTEADEALAAASK